MTMAKKKAPADKRKSHKQGQSTAPSMTFKEISTDLIDDPERPIRKNLTPASVEDLVVSIKQVGIIEPLVVKPVNKRYEVIAGHRRLFASKIAKLPIVPCYIRPATKEQTEMLKIHENLYRAEIKPADEAVHFSYMIQKQKLTPVKIAQLISKSPSYVTDRLAILEYPDFLKEALDSGEISFSVAREFARFDDLKQMRQATYYARRGGMTQELARKWVQDHKRSKEQPQLQEQQVINGESGQQEIVHSTKCVYCGKSVKLLEAEVVYMHSACLKEATSPTPTTTPQPAGESAGAS